MEQNSLHLMVSEVDLYYNRQDKLKQIRLGANKVKEMKGNGLLSEERLSQIQFICLIKNNKNVKLAVESVSLKIRQQEGDTELGKLLLKVGHAEVERRIGEFDVTKLYSKRYILAKLSHHNEQY